MAVLSGLCTSGSDKRLIILPDQTKPFRVSYEENKQTSVVIVVVVVVGIVVIGVVNLVRVSLGASNINDLLRRAQSKEINPTNTALIWM